MVILSGSHTTCLDVIKYCEIPLFIHDSSEIMTGFVSMAAGEKMVFPMEYLINKISVHFNNDIMKENIRFVVKIKEWTMYNTFEMLVATIEAEKLPEDISFEVASSGIEYKSLGSFSARPKKEKIGHGG
ncbi:MAG: hypothetical protein WC390_11850 [Sulfurimonas sp.]|jgi:hypothetical protein